jgi:hypothetical protein
MACWPRDAVTCPRSIHLIARRFFVDGDTEIGIVESTSSVEYLFDLWNFVDIWKAGRREEELQTVQLQIVIEQVYGYLSFDLLQRDLFSILTKERLLADIKPGLFCNQESCVCIICATCKQRPSIY